ADRASTYVPEDRSAAGRTVSDVETAERRGPARESGERTRSEVQEAPPARERTVVQDSREGAAPTLETAERAASPPVGTREVVSAAEIVGTYHGQNIHRDIAPQASYTVGHGETLEQIARHHVGADAPQSDVDLYVREIRDANHLRPGQPVSDGQHLLLPGNTADGGSVLAWRDGHRRTEWPNGTVRIERADGSGEVRRVEGEGYSQHHWGRRPEDNYDLVRTADGHYRLNGAEVTTHTDPRVERERARDLADHIADPRERSTMQSLVRRYDEFARREGRPPEETARVMAEISQQLQLRPGETSVPSERVQWAIGAVRDGVAAPGVDQGPAPGGYHGEVIHRDVQPQHRYAVQDGQTLEQIAQQRLGTGASQADIQ